MNKIITHKSLRLDKSGEQEISDCLLVERALQIIVNGEDLSVTMQTPGDERYLVRGLLHSEGLSSVSFNHFALENWELGTVARVQIQEQVKSNGRRFGSSPSCGICGKRNVEALFGGLRPLNESFAPDQDFISRAFAKSAKAQLTFSLTGGSHAAGAYDEQGDLLCVFEDVGRHNAVDKVVGFLLEQEKLDKAKMLTVSGRVSFEIIQKCCRAGIPLLASISAPSSLAVEWAEKLNISLAAF